MPPPSSAQQKVLIAQFVSLTGATERQATRAAWACLGVSQPHDTKALRDLTKSVPAQQSGVAAVTLFSLEFLKNASFKMNEAVDTYFSSDGNGKGPSPVEAKLESLFDQLQDSNDEKDKLELDSTMAYLTEKLKINIENAELLVVLELLQAPSVGMITRRGYVDGWKNTGVGASHQEHAAHLRRLISSLSSDPALFKKVYRYAFVAGREPDQKALGLENALVYWDILFASPGMEWKTANHDWLDLWKSFLNAKWTRSVNKDMWNMTLEFAVKSLSDESLSFWNEDGAWPSVIDDFVEWCREKGIGKADGMDVDDN